MTRRVLLFPAEDGFTVAEVPSLPIDEAQNARAKHVVSKDRGGFASKAVFSVRL